MPRVRTLTLARGFKFQTATINFLLPSFARYTAAKQNMRTNGLGLPHVDTVTETGRQKFTSIATIYECVWERESKLCCYDSYQEKSLLSNITIKIDHHFEPKSMFARIIVALDRLLWPQRWLPFCSSLFLKLLTYLHCDMHAMYLIRCFSIVCSEGS